MSVISIATNDVLRVKHFTWMQDRTQLGINVVHYKVTGISPGSPANVDLVALANTFADSVDTLYVAALNTDCNFLGSEVGVIYPTVSVSEGNDALENDGAKDSQVLPGQVTMPVTFYSASAGRSGRGRIYIPFPTEQDNAGDGAPDPVYVAECQAIADAITGLANAGDGTTTLGIQHVVWSPTYEGSSVVTRVLARGRWGTQRRRGMYGSINDLPSWVTLPITS